MTRIESRAGIKVQPELLSGESVYWAGMPLLGGRGQKKRSMSRFDLGDVPVFADIDDVDGAQRLVQELREQIRKSRAPLA